MSESHEEGIIKYEAARNEAMDSYFNARSRLLRTREKETLFEAGFRMAWNTRADKAHYLQMAVDAVELALKQRASSDIGIQKAVEYGAEYAIEAIKQRFSEE